MLFLSGMLTAALATVGTIAVAWLIIARVASYKAWYLALAISSVLLLALGIAGDVLLGRLIGDKAWRSIQGFTGIIFALPTLLLTILSFYNIVKAPGTAPPKWVSIIFAIYGVILLILFAIGLAVASSIGGGGIIG